MAASKGNSNSAIALARFEEHLRHIDRELKELKGYLKDEHLKYIEERLRMLEGRNDAQDKKIEKNTKAMWKIQTIYTTVIVVINVAFMVWRVFGG